MADGAYMLLPSGQSWRVARIAAGQCELHDVPDAGEGDVFGRLLQVLEELGHKGQSVCLALSSSYVFCARLNIASLPRKNRSAAMLYRLEEQLPLEAERLTADFLPMASGFALGFAVETAGLKEIVDKLLQNGIRVGAICPASLLAAFYVQSARGAEACNYILISDEGRLELCRIDHRTLSNWYCLDSSPEKLSQSLAADMLSNQLPGDHPTVLVVGGLSPDAESRLKEDLDAKVIKLEKAARPAELAAQGAAQVLAGKLSCVDFNRGALLPAGKWGPLAGHLKWARSLAIVLLVALSVSLGLRAWLYQGLTARHVGLQQGQYRRVFPTGPIPQDLNARMKSELARVSGISGGSEMPTQPNAINTLGRVIAAMPDGMKFKINEIRVSPQEIILEGQVLNHGDAGILAQAINRAGFFAEAPKTQQLPRNEVAFTLVARLSKESKTGGTP